ncbi:MAG: prephenate dehydrogenase/arogenate dehydrogenase family protein [Opitutales bacterium]|nr:prephenate dehydrogenase/arogenate dehydrogenase family protein [Opitutales bacterium]
MTRIDTITVIAPGLLGASLAFASRERGMVGRVKVWARRAEVLEACRMRPWCDSVHSDLGEAVADADMVWICAPVGRIAVLAEQTALFLKPGAIVSDVGSTKAELHAAIDRIRMPEGSVYVGSHPMAGSEKSGFEYADAGLFEGRPCFVTEGAVPNGKATEAVVDFWTGLGMRVTRTTPELHDRMVAWLSHVPHLTAVGLSRTLAASMPEEWMQYAGPGLRDTTRVASGSVEMWRDILDHNRSEIVSALSQVIATLQCFERDLKAGEMDALVEQLKRAKVFRDELSRFVGPSAPQNGAA